LRVIGPEDQRIRLFLARNSTRRLHTRHTSYTWRQTFLAKAAYSEKTRGAIEELEKRLRGYESAGSIVVETEKDLHATLLRLRTPNVRALDTLTNIPPLIDSLGNAGVLKDDETSAIVGIINSVKDFLQSQET
jgi:hypothetical protein